MAGAVTSSRGGFRIAAGAAILVVSGLLVLRASGAWPGDAVVWPSVIAALGGLVIWRQPRRTGRRRRAWAAHPPAEPPAPARATPALLQALPRPELSGMGLGIALVLGAGLAFLWANGALRPAGDVVLAALVALMALALIFAPSWRRLASSLATERAERVRAQEREEVAAHLHDSVLQTLALIQRNADDPKQVATLARRQERDLRGWLAGEEDQPVPSSLAAALDSAAAELEESLGATVEVVTVGDGPLDDSAAAVVGAAREAMLNAAKFAPGTAVSVYAEVGDERIQVFVRDRGDGFDPEAVPPERHGLRESITGRMRRAGGTAVVRAQPGRGTEIELSIAREAGG